MNDRGDAATRWRGELRRDVALLIVLKVAALALLWALFFAPRGHLTVDGPGASRHLGLADRHAERSPAIIPPARAPESSP